MAKSKTSIAAGAAVVSTIVPAFSNLPQIVSLALIAVAVGAGVFIIWDRHRKAALARKALMEPG